MAKRFTDTDKWKKKFIRSLATEYKLLWFYILDDCDHAGIWHVNFDVASMFLNVDIDNEKAFELFKDKIQIFDNGEKWFMPSFIEFQYGTLTEKNRMHNTVILRLKKYDLYKPLISPLQGVKEQEQVKDKDKVKEQEKEQDKKFILDSFEKFWKLYPRKISRTDALNRFTRDVKKTDYNQLLIATENYNKYVTADNTEPKFIKHAATWLNNERWKEWIIFKSESKPKPKTGPLKPVFDQSQRKKESPENIAKVREMIQNSLGNKKL